MPEKESLKSTAAWLCTSNPSNVWAEGTAHSLPENFGRYRIVKKLGEGGMGAVYLAHDTVLDRQVALKVPRFAATDDSEVLDRFRQEAKAAANVQHPNLCPIFDVGAIDGIHYLTMAYIEGKSLHDWIAGKPLAQSTAAKLTRLIALGLDAAHAKGVIHRDLKPSNILINERKEPIVMDFGLARRTNTFDTRLTCMGLMMGTPAYMSPEQARGNVDATGPRSDVYTLGVILYELLTGRLPFTGSSALEVISRVTTDTPAPPSLHRADLDPELERICVKAMAKTIDDRYPTMRALADDLRKYLEIHRGKETPAKIVPAGAGGRAAPVAAPIPGVPIPRAPVTYVGESRRRPVLDKFPVALPANQEAPHVSAPKQQPASWIDSAKRHKVWLASLASAGLVAILVVVFLRGTPERPEVVNADGKKAAGLDSASANALPSGNTAPSGFRPLFNGKDLTGFVVDSGNPERWGVENGELVVTGGKGIGWLLTEAKYSDFVLRLEFQPSATGNSGIALRATPGETSADPASGTGFPFHLEVQVLHGEGDSPAGSRTGALYWAKRVPPRPPQQQPAVLNSPGSWNRLEITMHGRSLRVDVNREQVLSINLDDLVGKTGAVSGLANTAGRIGFQSHTGAVRFRNIEIKELTVTPAAVTSDSFFNGKDLTGWEGLIEGFWKWDAEQQALVGTLPNPLSFNTNLCSRRKYGDFELSFQVKIPKDGNSGVQIRSEVESRVLFHCKGPQCDMGIDSKGWSYWGSLYGERLGAMLKEVNQELARRIVKDGDWNDLTIRAVGKRITIQLNGETTVDDLFPSVPDTGIIAFQLHYAKAGEVRFRKIRLKEIQTGAVSP